jgi:hypothetical protein
VSVTRSLAVSAGSGRLTLCGAARVPGDADGGFAGDVAELVAFGSALGGERLRAVEGWLARGYGVAVEGVDKVPQHCAAAGEDDE